MMTYESDKESIYKLSFILFHIIKFKTYALTERGSFNYLSLIALIPGNSFPSKYSNDAPPPVEI